ncbi:hypothetical protein [Pseudobacteriovorax antillogorgiicola]|uniref:Outer membrane protein beta-barrel domain-containing protein n=1 Tax=Pseudobacteriovorax antillogorgiicola TaxID=1513793 RepID=A0A1Y6BML8_9BACT|nr:hypothetical protein [Pseudobacteriovorax antillogorgiicola]TCS55585.1 hypothetical protein EDD56_105311 [Pseudobacteriovorax antillogorgiicola]SMF10612.1 hypothetical protein SAMN06296036_10513 [Pseudobacteriovorax antillogorgiicola]
MKLLSKLLLTNLLVIQPLYAQEIDSEEETQSTESGNTDDSPLESDSSQALRLGKQGAILFGVGGRTEGLTEGTIAYQHYLDPNSQILVNYSSMDSTIKEEAGEDEDGETLVYVGVSTEVKGSALSVSLRKFYGNSFYIEGGLDYAMVEGSFIIDETVLSERSETDLGSYSKLSAMFQIGNQWQWEAFTLGTSWVGILVPIAGTQDFTTEAEAVKNSINSIEKFMDNSDNVQLSALRFHLGWAF